MFDQRIWPALAAVIALTGSPIWPLQAQVQSAPPNEAIEAARDLLALMSKDLVVQLAGQVTAQLWPSIETRLRAYNPKIDAASLAELRKELERIQFEYMMNIVTEGPAIYARHFTAQELREIIAFYRTPTGSKVLRMTPQLSAEVTAMITSHMPDFYTRTSEAFTKVLRSRGYNL
jgi:hypothetical protein